MRHTTITFSIYFLISFTTFYSYLVEVNYVRRLVHWKKRELKFFYIWYLTFVYVSTHDFHIYIFNTADIIYIFTYVYRDIIVLYQFLFFHHPLIFKTPHIAHPSRCWDTWGVCRWCPGFLRILFFDKYTGIISDYEPDSGHNGSEYILGTFRRLDQIPFMIRRRFCWCSLWFKFWFFSSLSLICWLRNWSLS